MNFSNFQGKISDLAHDRSSLDKLSWSGLPVICDEVFSGIYRLGHFSASELLGIKPDISVHAKLLTGGLIPLSVTLASKSIFDVFLGDEKSAALLHGHSYTAHPVGCEVALKSLEMFEELGRTGHWNQFSDLWTGEIAKVTNDKRKNGVHNGSGALWSTWSRDFVVKVSHDENVEGVIALGSVLAISFKDAAGEGMFVYLSYILSYSISTKSYTFLREILTDYS